MTTKMGVLACSHYLIYLKRPAAFVIVKQDFCEELLFSSVTVE